MIPENTRFAEIGRDRRCATGMDGKQYVPKAVVSVWKDRLDSNNSTSRSLKGSEDRSGPTDHRKRDNEVTEQR